MTLRVLFVPHEADAAEEAAAWAWLSTATGFDAARAAPDGVPAAAAEHAPHVIWAHATSSDAGRADAFGELRGFARPEGRMDAAPAAGAADGDDDDAPPTPGLLLTGGAAALPVALGLELEPPNEVGRPSWRDEDDELYFFKSFADFPHIRGHAAFRGHPLLAGLGSGVYTWWPKEDEAFTRVAYGRPAWPMNGRVLAVERSYIHMNADRATIWEYGAGTAPDDTEGASSGPSAADSRAGAGANAGATRVLCIGAYFYFASPDPLFRPLLERLARNALRYAAGRSPGEGARPRQPDGAPASTREDRSARAPAGAARDAAHRGPRRPGVWRCHTARTTEEPTLDSPEAPSLAEPLPPFDSPLRLAGPAADDSPFTLAGRRSLAAGGEARGLDELWVHPLRVMRRLRVEDATAMEAVVTPVGVERRLSIGGNDVVERIFVPRDLPAAVIEWSVPMADASSVELTLAWLTDLRLAWPYPAGALGPLHWRRDDRAVHVRADEPDDHAFFAFSRAPNRWEIADRSTPDSPALEHTVALRLAPGESVRLAAVATTEGASALRRALGGLSRSDSPVPARAGALARLRASGLAVDSPDPRVAEAIEWARYRLDAYRVDTPGVGRSLVAGYWTSRDDWFHDGRPGYAWYFGRDAVWTALGSLAAGDAAAAGDVIRFLGRHQDLSGKIPHECTTSGVVHYDAADATPLYLLLIARYAAWTGDLGLVREEWDRARRAFEFCLSTDRDGDGLIENTRVGHGWVEFGRLGGGEVTFYNAGIWTAALRELADAAEGLGDDTSGDLLRARAETARAALEEAFHEPDRACYALNVRRPGDDRGTTTAEDADRAEASSTHGRPSAWERNPAQTAMQAVPLLLGAASPDRARGWYDAVAGDDFTAPWGVRMLARSDPDYDPTSYHGGAVWPLYTGWVSWAEYAAGRAESGFRHWRMVVEQGFERARGAWDEVLHGDDGRSIGVCPDQAWSTAMVVAPFVYGLLGAEPDALKHRLRLRPQIPADWDRLEVERLRVGDAEVALRYRRDGAHHIFRFEQTSGATPLRVIFEPALPGERLAAARVDDRDAALDARAFGERVLVPLQIVLDHERVVELETAGDPVPAAARPDAGD